MVVMAGLLSPAAAMADQATKFEPLTIQEQGSFAVGGPVVKTSGTYDNNKPTTEGQSFTAIISTPSTRCRRPRSRFRSSCCTALTSRAAVGKPHPMGYPSEGGRL